MRRPRVTDAPASSPTVDDEEEMLYGDSGSLFSPSKEEARRSSQPPADRDPTPFRAEPTHWCLLVRENGTMEVCGAPCPVRLPVPRFPWLPVAADPAPHTDLSAP